MTLIDAVAEECKRNFILMRQCRVQTLRLGKKNKVWFIFRPVTTPNLKWSVPKMTSGIAKMATYLTAAMSSAGRNF